MIGGGTGSYTVLKGLKDLPGFELTAIVTMADDGGSTGRLRDEFGTLPVGDVRSCLVALSSDESSGQILRELFLYRFPKNGSSLSGHNFGNLFLTALTNILGDEEQAIEAASHILNVKGEVIGVTRDKVNLVAKYENGEELHGESEIDEPPESHDANTRVLELRTEPEAQLHPDAAEAIAAADLIIIGPGDLYSSLLSNLVIKGMPEALQAAKAKFAYVSNLVSKYGQTHGLTQQDYVNEIAKYAGRKPDAVLINNAPLPESALKIYEQEQSFEIVDDLKDHQSNESVIRADLVSSIIESRSENDTVQRSLIRHDSNKLASELAKLLD